MDKWRVHPDKILAPKFMAVRSEAFCEHDGKSDGGDPRLNSVGGVIISALSVMPFEISGKYKIAGFGCVMAVPKSTGLPNLYPGFPDLGSGFVPFCTYIEIYEI